MFLIGWTLYTFLAFVDAVNALPISTNRNSGILTPDVVSNNGKSIFTVPEFACPPGQVPNGYGGCSRTFYVDEARGFQFLESRLRMFFRRDTEGRERADSEDDINYDHKRETIIERDGPQNIADAEQARYDDMPSPIFG